MTRSPIAYRMIIRHLLLVCCLLMAINVVTSGTFAEYRPLGKNRMSAIYPTETRTVIDLSGSWQLMKDASQEGQVQVPGAFPSYELFTVRRSVKIDGSTLAARTWHLNLLGVVDEIELRINGRFIMRYPGGMVPFSIRIPDRVLVDGVNTIELAVSPTGELTRLTERFARQGVSRPMGVIREVFLVGTPHVWTNDVRVRTTLHGSSGTVKVRATVVGGTVERLLGGSNGGDALSQGKISVSVDASIRRRDGGGVIAHSTNAGVVIERSRQQQLTFSLSVSDVRRWSITSPELYDLVVRIEYNGVLIDSYETPIGFRTTSISTTEGGRRISLNDSATFLNAVEYVEDYPGLGASMSYQHFEQDVAMLKTLGVNVIRIRHGSPHPYLLSLCDRYGLMVMAEIPAADVPVDVLQQEELVAKYRNLSERAIAYLDSHPSVLALGISDGLQEGAEGVASYHASMVKLYRGLTAKMLYKVVPVRLAGKTSEGGFDIIVARYYGRSDMTGFDRSVQQLTKLFRSAAVITEFGALVSPGNMNGFSDPLSNEAQALVVRDSYRATRSAGLAGAMIWAFSDYMLIRPSMLVDHYDPYVCTSGLVDVWRQPRISYTMLKSLINDEKEPLLQAREASFDTPLIFIATGLFLALTIAFQVNRSRRFREYVVRALIRPYNFYSDIRDQRIMSTTQSMILGIVISGCVGLVLASLLYFVRVDAESEYLLHLIIPSDSFYEIVRYVSWKPWLAVVLWTSIAMISILALSALVRIGAMFIKSRILFRDSLTIVVWSFLPVIALLPIGVAFYQALTTDAMSIWVPVLIAVLATWSLARTLRATSVVYDVPGIIVYVVGIGVLACSAVVSVVVWNTAMEGFSFLRFFLDVVTA